MRRRQLIFSLLIVAASFTLAFSTARAALVCTTQEFGKDEFRGISGVSDDNVVAVGKKGTIYRWDGTSWSEMTSGSNKDLNDVEMVGSTGFAVGRDGEVLQLSGGVWTSIGGFTNEDLFGVWAASPTEVYVVGKKGTLFSYDGVSWTDESAAAGADNKDIEDAWGDANFFYAIGEQGRLYRYDRSADAWLSADTSCTVGERFEDLWGDSNGNVYLVGKKNVHLYDGSSCAVLASANEDLRGVYGWTQQGRVVAVGKKGTVFEYDGSTWTETQTVEEDELKDSWVSSTGNAYFAGKKKELTVCQCTDCQVLGLPQFLITHDSYGIHCQSEVIQVQVIDSTSGTPRNDYNAQITLDTQSGFGSWNPVAGSGTLNDATLNDGLAIYSWPLGESTAAFALSYPEGPASIDVDVFQSNDTGIRDNDAEGTIVFSPSGFTLTAAALSNPPPSVIVPFSMPQVAGTDFPVHIAAYGVTPNDPVCGVIESYTGPKNLKFWFDFINPVGGSIMPTIDALAVPAVEAAATDQPVTFANGQAVVSGRYKDVGQIQINVKDNSQPHPDLPNDIRGATAGFVVKPYQFVLSNIEDGTGNPNPAAPDANGDTFVAAGAPFAVSVAAVDAEGDITPNYGQENIPETVLLTSTLVAPAAGDNPAIASGFGPFVAGQATGSSFSWPEVGIISLTPSVGDGDYLGAGDVSGVTSGNVGRFHAHHFTTALNTPTFATSCSAGSFTYIGETFAYSNQPVITTTARALAGEITENYAGGFFKISNTSLPDPIYTSTPAALDTSGLPPGSSDPAVAETGAGTGTLTFNSGSGLSYTRGTEQSPFDADIRLSIDVLDSDGAAASNPIEFGTAGGILFDAGAEMRFGRGRLQNAYGSELVNLAVPFSTEYFVDAATGFVTNINDSCTTAASVSLGAFTENLAAGETCVLDSGAPGDSGTGCAAAGPLALRFRAPPLGGDFNLHLQAPGAGNEGSTTATADMPDWLEFDWDNTLPGLEDPTGTAVFGIFRGVDRRIYIRELY